jgi:hypothetical protein
MNHCKTCAHWKLYEHAYPNAPRSYADRVEFSGGLCTNPKLREGQGKEDYEPDSLTYPYLEGGHFWTGPDFGCVHHVTAQTPDKPAST